MFQHFGQRLKRDLKQLVDRRLEASVIASGSAQKVREHIRSLALHLSHGNSRPVLKSMSLRINARDTQYGSVVLSLRLS